ncbi:polyphenol oxidase family protein [Psychrobacter sp. SZ93C1]|uniref:polyphenol oxidase family protein n=1 Tax=Psychrobacter sp. SZ93C1 TaxID=2792058 RepID=UPI0018CE08DA|nr:polyphenol oxidase family protein [Psychrobacter sp. SZ93C1]MBH0064611.1 laccase domain-containing protein [Psychrobacter sp. SZ93C1]
MINKLPMTLLAQIDDVVVFQTAAFLTDVVNELDSTSQPAEQTADFQVGQANYGELNLGLHVNDDATKVLHNRMCLLSGINESFLASESASKRFQYVPIKRLHWVSQVHGNQVHDVDASALSMTPMAADAMVSQQQGIGLAIMTADCVPIVLYQPATGQIAAIHAGWQGLACGVIKTTVNRFDHTMPIQAWIGVCISQANYEVNTDVRDKLLAGCKENQALSEKQLDDFVALFSIPSQDVKIKLDLPKLAAMQLETAGVTVINDLPVDCSYADSRYYSYRRQTHLQQPATGRMALVIARSTQSSDG